ncbi:N-formylmaleamate deformylase [Amycolatopsis lurida]|uniref:N-carbamoylsarcosine amidase n=1 Tax=Amycolatopsis lurida NRRL 2430 TaxID=1460371 RepID=A0A2P2FPW5_AMYLU|nr:isochorismatase family protein [Amycolatopsis lurida]KFU78763.1 N-carbamoylsarcosine amidase [Amycolatopsis lurida NRRL 2430]SEB31828.1 N-formylmaleamate deformylase [Amycolatopsis lurida]
MPVDEGLDSVYDRAGFGASVPRGSRPALVVVDLTRGFTEPGFPSGADLTAEVTATAALVAEARRRGIPVIYTAISYTPAEADGDAVAWLRKAPGMRALREGSEAIALDPRLEQRESDHLILKKGASAFHGTSLAALLTSLGTDTVVVCGATTSGCVRATAVDAVQSGFNTLVVREACGDRARGPHDAALFDLQAKYADVVGLDDALAYLSDQDLRTVGRPALADLGDVPATSRWVRSGPVRLHVLDYGPSDGAPVLVLPGITSPAVTMDFVARELTDLVRPLVLDVRGRGLSDDAPDYDLASYAADVEAVVDGLGLRDPILFGHSMGARIAARAATSRPYRGTVLADPPLSGPGRAPYPTTLDAFLGQLAQARRGTDADEVARSWPRWPRREQELRARWLSSCSRSAIAATHAGFESEDFFADWPKVPAPAYFLYGGASPVVTAAGAAEAAERNPSAELVEIAGAGHMIFWDEPEAALGALREALRKLL